MKKEDEEVEQNPGKTAGVILASGGATRFGTPKQLLRFGKSTFIEQVIETCIEADLAPIVVVVGYEADLISEKIKRFTKRIEVIRNTNWQFGQSQSMRIAIPFLNKSTSSLFLLSDQPQIPSSLLEKLMHRFSSGVSEIVAPFVGERRANPVLFSRKLYGELSNLSGDKGGRQLFANHDVERVDWDDDRILIDVDTPEDYERLKRAYGFK